MAACGVFADFRVALLGLRPSFRSGCGYSPKQGTAMTDQELSTRRATGLAGLGVAILFGVGNALWALEQPNAGAPTRAIIAFYTNTSARIIVGASLSLFAGALFVFFASGVRAILRSMRATTYLPPPPSVAHSSWWRPGSVPRPSTCSGRCGPATASSRRGLAERCLKSPTSLATTARGWASGSL